MSTVGIINTTARQFNLKAIGADGAAHVVRLVPGANVVPANVWAAFVGKDGKKVNPYIKQLKAEGKIRFGLEVTKAVESNEEAHKAATKSSKAAKPAKDEDDL